MVFDFAKMSEEGSKEESFNFSRVIYNPWHGTTHKEFTGFFTPYQSVTEFAMTGSIDPAALIITSSLLAPVLAAVSVAALTASVVALAFRLSMPPQDKIKQLNGIVRNNLLVTFGAALLSVALVAAIIPMLVILSPLYLITRSLATVKNLILKPNDSGSSSEVLIDEADDRVVAPCGNNGTSSSSYEMLTRDVYEADDSDDETFASRRLG